jgi:hypothetical protein
VNIDLVACGVCSEANGISKLFQMVKTRIVKKFKVPLKVMLHHVCPFVLGVSGEVLMDSTNVVPSFKINEKRECSQNVDTLILVTKYTVKAMCPFTLNKVNWKKLAGYSTGMKMSVTYSTNVFPLI